MRIALVANGFPVVSETFIYNHACGLIARGHEVVVVTAGTHGDPAAFPPFPGEVRRAPTTGLRAAAATLAVPRERALSSRAPASRRGLRAWLLARALADVDLVHVEYTGLAVAWLDALRLLSVPIVVSCRGTAERIKPVADPARAEALRALFAVVTRVHCVSADMVRVCAAYGLDPAKAFVNRPAIDAAAFQRRAPYAVRGGAYRLLTTGRLHWPKGLEWGVLAARELIARGHDVHYDIVGGGDEEAQLRFAIHDLGLGARVHLLGRRPPGEIRAALETADVYLSPSVSEGISNAALEAMAMAIPVVSTAVGGMSEAIRDGVEGLLVPSRDPAAMATAVATLLADPGRARFGTAARARIEREFTLRRLIDVFVAEYESLVHGRSPR